MQEIWKDIYFIDKGIIYNYKGLYQVSNFGRIKSLPRNGTVKYEKLLTLKSDKYGYICVDLYKENRLKTFKVHRLVGFMFLENPNELPEINHINKQRNCNLATNLEWCDNPYNIRYSRAKKVIQYDKQGNFIKEWDCIREVERKLNICNGDIVKCCKGKHQTAGGYTWRYKDSE